MSNEDDRPDERKKHRKKRFSKYSITSGSSSEEEEDVNKKSQARNISKQSTKPDSISVIPAKNRSEAVIQQDEGSIPVGRRKKVNLNEETLPTIQTGRTKNCKVETKLLNGFFQRKSEEKEDTSENNPVSYTHLTLPTKRIV